jgi:hypothetical protein
MKKLVLVTALAAALAACSQPAEEADDTAVAEAAPEATPTSSAGNYDVTMADGTAFTAVLNADGTYQDLDAAGTVTESGTWEDRDDGSTCFDSEGGDDTVVCFTVGEAAEDGSMVATPDDGSDPLTIKRTSCPPPGGGGGGGGGPPRAPLAPGGSMVIGA